MLFKKYRIYFNEYYGHGTYRFNATVCCLSEKSLKRKLEKINTKDYSNGEQYLYQLSKQFKVLSNGGYYDNVSYTGGDDWSTVIFQRYELVK